jgi:hypothetical protein
MNKHNPEQIPDGPSRNERMLRHFAEAHDRSVGIIEETDTEFLFQVLEGAGHAVGKQDHETFLNELQLDTDLFEDKRAVIENDPTHGWHIKISLAE